MKWFYGNCNLGGHTQEPAEHYIFSCLISSLLSLLFSKQITFTDVSKVMRLRKQSLFPKSPRPDVLLDGPSPLKMNRTNSTNHWSGPLAQTFEQSLLLSSEEQLSGEMCAQEEDALYCLRNTFVVFHMCLTELAGPNYVRKKSSIIQCTVKVAL